MNRCEFCGCRTNNGTCSYCMEELYIIENQADYILEPVSDEFTKKTIEQKKIRESQVK